MLDVITIGSATIDVFAVISKKSNQVKQGDKILIEEIAFEIGGGGVNPAIGLTRMGLNTAFLGKLGHDHNAAKIIHELKKEGVKVIKTTPSEYPTSYSFILKSKQEQDRILFAYKGASDYLTKVPKLKAKYIYLATMLNKSFKTANKIAKYTKKQNIKLLFNPSSYLAAKGKFKLRKILKNTTFLILNKREAELLLKKKADIPSLAKSLSRLGPKIVIITQGAKGVNAYDGINLYHLPIYPVKIKNTTGAGDAFASGFLAGIIHHKDLVHALELGMANAASVVQYYGTRNKLLTYKEAIKFIKSRKEKVIIRKI